MVAVSEFQVVSDILGWYYLGGGGAATIKQQSTLHSPSLLSMMPSEQDGAVMAAKAKTIWQRNFNLRTQ